MATQRITERFAFTGGKVRRPGVDGYTGKYPVIEGVLLCGAESQNRRRYKPAAFGKPGDKLYENKPVFIDHTDSHGRKYRDHIGWVDREYRNAAGLPVGDIGVKPTHRDAESVLWDAENRPSNCGMSHVAECQTKRARDGWDEVESIREVASVDIVIGPATTKSFFEQTRSRTVGTLRTVLEGLLPQLPPERARPARKWLVLHEDDAAMAPMLDTPVDEPVEGTDPDQAISDAFKTAMHAQIDALLEGSHTLAELISKIRELGKAHGKLTGAAATTDTDSDDDGESDAEESKRPTLADLVRECKAKQFTATLADVALLEGVPTEEARGLIIDRLKGATAGGEQPRSTGRESVVREHRQRQDAGKVPTDPKAFAESITG